MDGRTYGWTDGRTDVRTNQAKQTVNSHHFQAWYSKQARLSSKALKQGVEAGHSEQAGHSKQAEQSKQAEHSKHIKVKTGDLHCLAEASGFRHRRTRRGFRDFRGSPLASASKWCRTQNQWEKSEKKMMK